MGLKAQISCSPRARGPLSASEGPPLTLAVHIDGFQRGQSRTRANADHSRSTLMGSSMAPATGRASSARQVVRKPVPGAGRLQGRSKGRSDGAIVEHPPRVDVPELAGEKAAETRQHLGLLGAACGIDLEGRQLVQEIGEVDVDDTGPDDL